MTLNECHRIWPRTGSQEAVHWNSKSITKLAINPFLAGYHYTDTLADADAESTCSTYTAMQK